MEIISDTTWEEVFDGWRDRESQDPGWIECATVVKGWEDWERWRKFMASQLDLPNLDWQIVKPNDPFIELPNLLIGPYNGWQSRLEEPNIHTFSDLLSIPKEFDYWKNHSKIKSMMQKFPSPTQLIVIFREDIQKFVCVEGHHRCVAITLSNVLHQPIDLGDITIALATLPKENCYLINEALKRNSSKNPSAK